MTLATWSALAALAGLAIFPLAAQAGGGDVDCPGIVIAVPPVAPVLYVDLVEVAGPEYVISAWLYAESNGVPGCQTTDSPIV